MSFDYKTLSEVPKAVRLYLQHLVKAELSEITPEGSIIDAEEAFTFTVTARNLPAAEGGVAIKNVRYRLTVLHPTVAKLIVPSAVHGTATGLGGTVLAPGEVVGEMILNPSDAGVKGDFKLGAGETHMVKLMGRVGQASDAAGKTTSMGVRVLAEIDLNRLFPNEQTSSSSQSIMVAPD
jgi:hypothetical protein